MPPADLPFVTCAPSDVAGWLRLFDIQALPVLAATAAEVAALRRIEDAVDAHRLSETVARDPLLTLKLVAHVALLRHGRDGGEVETVTEALVMLGIPPFFRFCEGLSTVEACLCGKAAALRGLQQSLRRARRTARFAIGFAVHRMDPDAAVIHEAALLHGFADQLLWLRAPDLAAEVARRQEADPSLRSNAAQVAVLNVTLVQLQQALMQAWDLPALLRRMTDCQAQATDAQLRNVQLAVRVARHSAHGWDNPALPDDILELGTLLQLAAEPVRRLLQEIDADEP